MPKQDSVIISTESFQKTPEPRPEDQEPPDDRNVEEETGVHFLSSENGSCTFAPSGGENGETYERKKSELLEYLTRQDGSVVCKLCGEVLASRTHWYRHKYKLHVTNCLNPAPLFKCNVCNVFFKSRKGYMGHTSTRHSENMEQQEELNIGIQEEIVETAESPKTIATLTKKKEVSKADIEEQRVREEKLVADIIDRVRKECEAQGAAVTRRGYSRRSTVMMNSCTN